MCAAAAAAVLHIHVSTVIALTHTQQQQNTGAKKQHTPNHTHFYLHSIYSPPAVFCCGCGVLVWNTRGARKRVVRCTHHAIDTVGTLMISDACCLLQHHAPQHTHTETHALTHTQNAVLFAHSQHTHTRLNSTRFVCWT